MLNINSQLYLFKFLKALGVTMFFLSFQINFSFGQKTIIEGRVLDSKTNESLISAAVAFEGTSIGTNTDLDGYFKLESEDATENIVVTYLGFKPFVQKIKIGTKQTVTIYLEDF